MASPQQRRKRNQRRGQPRPMTLTPRDTAILAAVYHYRVLRQDQIHALFFGASKTTSQRRLELLYDHGFLNRRFLTVRASYLLSPTLYVLDARGVAHLRSHLGDDALRWQSSDLHVGQQFLEHTLAINDVRIAVTLACQMTGYTLLTWQSETDLKATFDRVDMRDTAGVRHTVSLIPDSYFVLDTPRGIAHLFLELDRGTMTTKRFQNKILTYLAYYQSGAYERRYHTRSLRILTVTLTARRLDSLRQGTRALVDGPRFWFSTLPAISAETVLSAPIWQIAGRDGYVPLVEPLPE